MRPENSSCKRGLFFAGRSPMCLFLCLCIIGYSKLSLNLKYHHAPLPATHVLRFSRVVQRIKSVLRGVNTRSRFRSAHWPGELRGDLMKASGLGATGCTGRVCLAASFFRLTLLLSNMSCMDVCFCSTFSTWSWCTRRWFYFLFFSSCFMQHVYFPLAVLTLNCWLSTASYSVVMVLRSVSWFWLALSR